MARAGEDARLAEMLLEVALDLEAEADAIEAEQRDAGLVITEPAETHPSWLWIPVREIKSASPIPAERVT
nr:hypothetical protein [uncultured Rhodopila sp.]